MISATFRRLPALMLPAFVALTAFSPLSPQAEAKKPKPDHWVATWATADYALPNPQGKLGATDMTYREIVRTSLGQGDLVRIELSNEFGTEPLTIGEVHLALADDAKGPASDINLVSAHGIKFNGSGSVVIAPGAIVVSDPVALKVTANTDLAISLFVPAQKMSTVTYHGSAFTTSYVAPGNMVRRNTLSTAAPGNETMDTKTTTSWFFLKSVDVQAGPETSTIVAFGDSITDGAKSTVNAHASWPSVLAERLHANAATKNLAIVNEGIGGNRVLNDGTGPSALKRFDDDVINIPGVTTVVILEGINDIGHSFDPKKPTEVVSADEIIRGMAQLATRAHAKGIKVIGATLTPYGAAGYQSPAGEQAKEKVNDWIRTTKELDGVIDFDKATRDPSNPIAFLPAYDSGDHLHPKDAGYKAMADSIDLKVFVTEAGKKK